MVRDESDDDRAQAGRVRRSVSPYTCQYRRRCELDVAKGDDGAADGVWTNTAPVGLPLNWGATPT